MGTAIVKTGANRQQLQQEIAARAARLVAEDGHDFQRARLKAAAQVLGAGGRAGSVLPDNDQIETALRSHLRGDDDAGHRLRLHRLRTVALEWMERLAPFAPHLVGPVLNGSATRHCPVHLQLFTDSAKDVEMALLDRGLDIRVAPPDRPGARAQEVIGFVLPTEPGAPAPRGGRGAAAGDTTAMLLTVFDADARRMAASAGTRSADPCLHPIERCGRADARQLRELLAQTSQDGTAPQAADVHA